MLIHNYTPSRAKSLGLDYERLSAVNDRLIVTQITTYGASGPKRDWIAHNLNAVAAGGWLYMSPGYSKNIELPPLKAFGQQGDFQGGANGAVATMGALFARRSGAPGQLVDVSIQEAVAAALELAFVKWTYREEMAHRCGTLGPSAPYGILRCKDGLLHFLILEEAHWTHLVEIMDNPEWTTLGVVQDHPRSGRESGRDRDARSRNGSRTTRWRRCMKWRARARLPIAPVADLEQAARARSTQVAPVPGADSNIRRPAR